VKSDASIPDENADLLEPEQEEDLVTLLRAAWQPTPLDEGVNRRLIELALEDPLAPPSADELVESERLRRALEGDGTHPDAALAQALRTAAHPTDAGALAQRRAEQIGETLPAAELGRIQSRSSGPSRVYVLVGSAAAALALAASVLIVLRPAERRLEPGAVSATVERGALTPARSTQELFSDKFEPGEASTRIDRIATARARELRSNRYALWGVR
jgi:hypothetical protein